MSSDAIISPCGKFRYRLRRDVPHAMRGANFVGGTCLFVMLNPSTADATADDPTILRCRWFALEWGRMAMEGIPRTAGRTATDVRADEVLRIIRASGHRPCRIGPPTKKGAPPHPLYLRSGLALEEIQ